jgi:hypothetical protein
MDPGTDPALDPCPHGLKLKLKYYGLILRIRLRSALVHTGPAIVLKAEL